MQIRTILAPALLVALFLLWLAPLVSPPALANIYKVTNTRDDALLGSLRRAILEANASPGPDTIVFDIPLADPGYWPVTGTWQIQLLFPLPELTGSGTVIDGATQAVNQGDRNPHGPEIYLDGSKLGGDMSVLIVQSNGNQILGLLLAHAPGPAIRINSGASGNIVRDNYIGLGADGVAGWGNGSGIHLSAGASENVITHNMISGNEQDGILISGSTTHSNEVRRNHVGLDATGAVAVPNGWDGIAVAAGAYWTTIGGQAEYRNVVGGNGQHGIHFYGSGTKSSDASYNYVGLDTSGEKPIGNQGSGIVLADGVTNISLSFNLVSGNQQHGVLITGAGSEAGSIYGNLIGAGESTNQAVPNGLHGLAVYDAPEPQTIGDHVPGRWPNVIVASGWSGVAIVNSRSVTVQNNAIGTTWDGRATGLGNRYHGVAIVNSPDCTIEGNRIAHNGTDAVRAGVIVQGATAIRNTISRNKIYDNSGAGIDLVDGGNGEPHRPGVTWADCQGVDGTAYPYSRVEIFSDENGEGRWYEGSITLGGGPVFCWMGKVQGPNVTVTMTDVEGNTSELSAPAARRCHQVRLPLVRR